MEVYVDRREFVALEERPAQAALVEREFFTQRLMEEVLPHERRLAMKTFLRNYVRPGATARGCYEYVSAVFAAQLRRPEFSLDDPLPLGPRGRELLQARQAMEAFRKADGKVLRPDVHREALKAAGEAIQ